MVITIRYWKKNEVLQFKRMTIEYIPSCYIKDQEKIEYKPKSAKQKQKWLKLVWISFDIAVNNSTPWLERFGKYEFKDRFNSLHLQVRNLYS